MATPPNTTLHAGVDRRRGRAVPQKITFAAIHTLAVGVVAWLLLLDGVAQVGAWLGQPWRVAVPARATALVAVTLLYWVRQLFALRVLIVRRVLWSEVGTVGGMLLVVEIGYALAAAGVATNAPPAFGWVDVAGAALVLVGSYLNSASELQRKWWKARPESAGHCYTEGLFRLSMHINYFGDVVLFSGWTMLTATWWLSALPLAMTLGFVFFHIPGLDRYLAERYGEEFRTYAERTKKLIPFVY